MATIRPDFQRFHDEKIGLVLGVHVLKLVSTSDTFTVPRLANTSASASSRQVRRAGETAVTVTDNGTSTVTVTGGSSGQEVTIVTAHNFINSSSEA